MRKTIPRLLLAVVVLAGGGHSARANVLLTNTPGYLTYHYGGFNWGGYTNALNAEFTTVITVPDLSNAASFVGVDAVMFVPRSPGASPLAAELANVSNFIATGKRTLLVGENSSWTSWNSAILGLVGGGYFGGQTSGVTPAVLAHPLTAGVPAINVPLGGVSPHGTHLFQAGFAALWQPGQSVLTMLDVNVVDDNHATGLWKYNVAAWLADGQAPEPTIPEPGTLALLASGGALALRRRRRSR